jgi:hypothetical protein
VRVLARALPRGAGLGRRGGGAPSGRQRRRRGGVAKPSRASWTSHWATTSAATSGWSTRFACAVSLERRALDILAAAYGDRHPFVLKELALLANTSVAMGGKDAARRDLLRIRAALAGAEAGGLAANLRDVVDQRLRALDGGTRLS